ncbi:MAG: hypothetical protein ACLFPS_01505 [Clostridia bacterium]
MIFDDSFYKLIIQEQDFDKQKLNLTRGYSAIKTHQSRMNTNFSIKDIKNALLGIDDSGYGLKNLSNNIDNIKELYKKLSTDFEWIDDVRNNLLKYFSLQCVEDMYICPVIGYDAGIGIENTVCVNFNYKPYQKNYKECIAVIIHEAAHVAFNRKHGMHLKFDTKNSVIEALQYLIQYEGIGIYIAKEYRESNNLINPNNNALRDDYHVSESDYKRLKTLYNKALSAKTYEEAIENAFEKEKLSHKLGYYIVNKYAELKGIDGIKEIINMNNKEFVKKFL